MIDVLPKRFCSTRVFQVPQRSPSTDSGKPEDPLHTSSGSGGSRFMKWLGLSSATNGIRKDQRRMSTY